MLSHSKKVENVASCLHVSQSKTEGNGRLIDGLTWMELAALPELDYSRSFILAVLGLCQENRLFSSAPAAAAAKLWLNLSSLVAAPGRGNEAVTGTAADVRAGQQGVNQTRAAEASPEEGRPQQ